MKTWLIVPGCALVGLVAVLATGCTIVTQAKGGGADAGNDGASTQGQDAGQTSTGADGGEPDTGATGPLTDGATIRDVSAAGDSALPTDAPAADSTGDASAITLGNGCADPPANNQTRDTATPYALGTRVRGCLRSGSDVNFYQYVVPSSPAKGGYVVVAVTGVDVAGNIDLTTQAVSDNGTIVNAYSTTNGASVFEYFTAAPGASFRAVITNFSVQPATQTGYAVTATFVGVNDPSAPNFTRATAAVLPPSTPVRGYFFAGRDSSGSPATTTWDSWYKVTLVAGTASVQLTSVAPDVTPDCSFYDANGNEIARHYSTTAGANVVFDVATAPAGDYYARVSPFSTPGDTGTTQATPAWMSQPYSLTVSNK